MCAKLPIRFWIGVMIFFTTFTNYMLRANMSVSIMYMMQKKNQSDAYCLVMRNETREKKNETGKLEFEDWDQNYAGAILGAYFNGYLVVILFGGMISEKIGPWHTILWCSVAGTALAVLTPLCARHIGWLGVLANRLISGMVGAPPYPALNTLIAKWVPPKEKGKFMAAMMGNTIGTVVAFNMVALVSDKWGWDWGFYCLVVPMGLFCLVFAILVADSPDQHRWISEKEKEYIRQEHEGHVSKKKKFAPLKKIFTSMPFWILVTAQFGNLWGLNLIMTYGPKYLSETIGYDLKSSAFLAALPYLSRLLGGWIFGLAGDYMKKKQLMSTTKIRKFFIIFSHFIPAACLYLIWAAECNAPGVVTLLILNQGFNGAVVVSHLINPQDLAPNFAGTVYGMMNFFGMTTGGFVPQITSGISKAYDLNVTGAGIIFILGGSVFAICGLVFVMFGTAEVQPWNEIKEDGEGDQK